VEEAAELLGRPHEVRGSVVQGDQRGRELGFPTANIRYAPETCLPAVGIYAGTLTAGDGVERPAAISLGRRPTFYAEEGELLLEVFVLDFSGDLYGQECAVRFMGRIRSEERFDSVEALVEQMHHDVETARRLLGAPR
jgi:riboflavin kinase/FMN adenylyltransferase